MRARRVFLVGAEVEENLSLRYVAAAAQAAGHEVEVLPYTDLQQLPAVSRYVAFHAPDFVGLSVAFQHRAREFLALAKRIREDGYGGHVCAGGHFPTFAWRELLERHTEIDTVVRHEGEDTIVELLEALDQRERWAEIPGVACRAADGAPLGGAPRRVRDDVDGLPFPLRADALVEHCGYPFASVVGSRGCFANCNYCCINTYHRSRPGRRYRERSAESIADEIAWLWHALGARVICFHDEDLFLPRPERTRARMEAIRAALDARGVGRIATVGKCRPDCVDEELLDWARERFGLVRIYLGIENGSEHGLQTLGRGTDLATCRRSLEVLRRAGTYACFNLLLFDPYTRLEDVDENIAFMKEWAGFPYNFCRTEIYAGTHFEQKLRGEGRLRGSYLGYGYLIEDPRVELVFRLMAVAFGERNFGAEGLCARLSMAGYEAALVQHFRPVPEAETVACAIRGVNRRSNLHAVEVMRRIREFAGGAAALRDAAAAQRLAVELALEVNRVSLSLGKELSGLRTALAEAPAQARV